MRIGELAELAGVTPRAVRHYHHLGLLPEPARRGNGYRDYGLDHAVLLARIRRLTELGLGLTEVKDVLADDAGHELAEVLVELDADLARQQRAIADRRSRLAELIEQARQGKLPPEGPVSPELAEIFGTLPPRGSASAAKDRAHLAMIDSITAPEDRRRIAAALRPLTEDPELAGRTAELYRRLDELADAGTDDPRIAPLAADLADGVPEELVALLGEGATDPGRFGREFIEDFPPAQAAVVRGLLHALTERRRPGGGPDREAGRTAATDREAT